MASAVTAAKTSRLVLERRREEQRKRMEGLCQQKFEIEGQMKELAHELEALDNEIDALEHDDDARGFPPNMLKKQPTPRAVVVVVVAVKPEKLPLSQQQQQHAGDEATTTDAVVVSAVAAADNDCPAAAAAAAITNIRTTAAASRTMATTTQADEILTDPMTMATQMEEEQHHHHNDDHFPEALFDDDDDDAILLEAYERSLVHNNSRSVGQGVGTLEFTTTTNTSTAVAKTKLPPQPPAPHPEKTKTGTLADYFVLSNTTTTTARARKDPPNHQHQPLQPVQHNQQQQQQPPPAAAAAVNSSNYPWSRKMMDLLHNTFKIPSFRDQQKDIIDATLAGEDVFVIMRTGGGKSLTYQLPALLEGRRRRRSDEYDDSSSSSSNKVTLVISPLLSLIQDQEEQMNAFCPGSAVSFTSGLAGGATEHARRWGLVRDPAAGVCLILVTPEKVSQSNKLCAELDKLFQQDRLGRFVVDEAHCACQWGHDFRPDYALLGKLKAHFPSIPVIAVTATASDRVRQDVCEILRLDSNKCRFFRSTANRPNLTYSVRPKPDGKDAVVAEMAEFIKERFAPGAAGIVYAYSRKDADTVASALCDYGVIAEAYHSDVSATKKQAIHRSWMRNQTQVVVATIAFGLGINKPDVRFVLHHSISKTLEAYYQESGRAGRDGNPAECILYYSPKDVIRLLKMVHGTSSEHLLWPMIRYAQQSGNDPICKAIMLTHLGEPNVPDVMQVVKENEGIATTPRDVGTHAQTLVKLLSLRIREGKDMTMAMLVKDWRASGAAAPQFLKDNPPTKDGLSVEECERIITSLLLENVLATNPIWNAYDTVIYFILGPLGTRMEQSANPKFVVQLPKRESKKVAVVKPTKASKQSRARKTVANDGEWLSAKPKAAKRKKAATAKSKIAKKGKVKTTKKKATKPAATTKKSAKAQPKRVSTEVIELLSDDDESSVDVPLVTLKQDSERDEDEELWDDGSSDEEFEFND